MNSININVPGYRITNQLYAGSRTLVYRGIRQADQLSVVLKLMREEYPSFAELVRFRNQYVIAQNLDLPNLVKPLALERYRQGYALVMEDVGGISLADYLKQTTANSDCVTPISITNFLLIGLQLAETLWELHRCRVIHKDIKPANILIQPETLQIKLIDFSIASVLPKETPEIENFNVLEGTLAYLSPEQTGRMNRGIDYRCDFYSLGVTFYQLLTGKLPFVSEDPMELVYCHIAKSPIPIVQINPDVPQVISEIVSKLMAKNAEDRYQSGLGIKHDLERCLQEWQQTGEITLFPLGQRDVSDRFLIPEKLYGREAEVKTLLATFDRVTQGTTELILVAGFSGIGKTAVVNEVHKPIVRQRGYFIKGKFDQFNRNIPLSAFVQAFRELMGQLLSESDFELQGWKTKILTALGENAQVILEVIPELEQIIGQQPPVPELSGSAAQNRFNLLFQKFIEVFTTPEHPLVIFLDDLQWADSASLNLMEVLISQSEAGYLLMIGAYRDNEVSPAHPLMLMLEELRQVNATVKIMTLASLSQMSLNTLVADTLQCTTAVAEPLSQLVYQNTQGNPFFSTQFLKALYEDGLITFNFEGNCWECDIVQVRQLALTDDVVEFMAMQLQKLPQATQNLLKLAACIGNSFDLATLGIISQQSETETAALLWKALQEGFILPQTQVYKFYLQQQTTEEETTPIVAYKFLHDRVQQAAYSLIPDDQKQITHYHIGQLLLQRISPETREERIFELLNQLNYGTALITQQKERDELAQLNLIACRQARVATAYQAAREYANTGLLLLGKKSWQRQDEMTLAFYDAAAELAALCGDFEAMEQFVETVIAKAHTLLEQVNVYRTLIFSNVSQNKLTEAIAIAQKLLQQLGVTFADPPTENDIQKAMAEIGQLIGDREIEDLVDLPIMTDREKMAIVQIANSIIPAAYITGSPLLPLVVTLSVKLSIQYGNTLDSVFAYACYSIIACNLVQDVKTGVKFGLLALQVTSKLDSKAAKPEAFATATLFSLHRQYPVKQTLHLSKEGYTAALEVGNLDFAGRSAYTYCINAFGCGQPLTTLEAETRAYCNGLVQLKQLTTANYCRIYWQSILNLVETVEHPSLLSGEALEEAELLPHLIKANDFFGLYFFYLYKLMLGYLFEEIPSAQNYAVEVRRYFMGGAGTFGEPMFYFYDSLTVLAALSSQSQDKAEALKQVEQNQTQLQQQWADYAPMNHQHKVDLVAAEKCRILGQKAEAIELYDKAISRAKENEYLQEEALANELAAKFYLDWGKEKVAAGYMQEAYYGYAHWGAKGKTDDLEKRYPQLLQPILNQPKTSFNPLETLASLTYLTPSSQSRSTQVSSSSSRFSETLDLTSVLKAAQAISSSIQLEELIGHLTQIILENSGAETCVLLLPNQNQQWQIRAITQVKSGSSSPVTQLEITPLAASTQVPVRLIQYVKRTQESIIINDSTTDIPEVIDEYLLEHQPQSVLCTPILNQSRLVGVLYLEHSFTKRVFTFERLLVLNFLCTQAAISLENAQLYNHVLEREKFLNSIYEGVGCLVFVIDVRDNNRFEYTGFSKSWELAIGIPVSEVVGKTPQDLLAPGEGEIVYQNYLRCLQTGTPLTYEECLTFNDHKTWWLTILTPLKDETGKVYRIVGTTINISERKQAEEALAEKSQALATALEDLQQAQLQVVQSEKMSALGNLVAGVAHEMNNPLGFISASLKQAQPTISDLIEHLKLYQESLPSPSNEILAHADEIDLNYSVEDLPKIIDSMLIACDRLKNISTSLRTFSRSDKDYKVPFNIHDGIDSTLLILKHRLKANQHRSGIEIIKEYGNIPEIECFPGQLNQVFMNIIANGIDALEELNASLILAETKLCHSRIYIKTSVDDQTVKITIADNGMGMSEEIKGKIFDHLFTTKGVGKGTGLGLAIAKSIVVEKHGGSIDVNSRLGEGTEFIITLPIQAEIKS